MHLPDTITSIEQGAVATGVAVEYNSKNIQRFLALAQKYTDLTELTPTIINEFLDKVVVHEAQKIDGRCVQDIEIYLNFIGKIKLPEAKPEQIDPVAEAKCRKRNKVNN